MTTRVAAAAPNRQAVDAALRVAAAGGTAVDAAVAAMLVAMVNEPGIVSIAGGAFVTVWPAEADSAVTVDGYVAMPGLGRAADAPRPVARQVRTDYGGGVTMTAGHAAVAVPGALAALERAHADHGRLRWADVVRPAEEIARGGFLVGPAAGYYLPYVRDTLMSWDPETAAAVRDPAGRPLGEGDRMHLAGLADTLAVVAADGAAAMHTGELAGRLVDDMSRRGGLVTADDLGSYRALVRAALPTAAGEWVLATNPPPAIGGAVLVAMLAALGPRPSGAVWTESDVVELVRAQRQVLDVRRESLDVAADRESAAYDLLASVGWRPAKSASTANVSVVDDVGTACAVTASYGYGSGVTVPGTGVWLNNCLGELELNRGTPIAPGERLRSNMAPTVGRRADGAVLAIGSPGADRITTALLQVVAAVAHGGMDLQAAVDLPRLHVHHLDDTEEADEPVRVEIEEGLPLPAVDLPVGRHHRHSMYFGGVGAALRHPDGRLQAAGDPRRAGAVAVGP